MSTQPKVLALFPPPPQAVAAATWAAEQLAWGRRVIGEERLKTSFELTLRFHERWQDREPEAGHECWIRILTLEIERQWGKR